MFSMYAGRGKRGWSKNCGPNTNQRKQGTSCITVKDREYFLPCVSLLEHTHVLPLEGNKFEECPPDGNLAHRRCCEFRENKKPNSDKTLILVIVKMIAAC